MSASSAPARPPTLDEGRIRLEATGKTNIIPAIAIARGDLRALTQDQIDRTQAKMRAIVAQPLPGATASITFDTDGYPPMAPTAGNRALLARLNAVNRDMGLPEMGALDPVKRGAGDISFVAADVDGLVGLGAASEGAHTDGETIDIPSICAPGQARRHPDQPAGGREAPLGSLTDLANVCLVGGSMPTAYSSLVLGAHCG